MSDRIKTGLFLAANTTSPKLALDISRNARIYSAHFYGHVKTYTAYFFVDPAKENRTPVGQRVRLVEKGTKPVQEALR